MKGARIIAMPLDHRRAPLLRAVAARRRLLRGSGGGRAWINGREVGGPDPRYSHLSQGHD